MGLHSVPGPQYVVSTIRHTTQDSSLSDPACGNKELFSLMAGGTVQGTGYQCFWLPLQGPLLELSSGPGSAVVVLCCVEGLWPLKRPGLSEHRLRLLSHRNGVQPYFLKFLFKFHVH